MPHIHMSTVSTEWMQPQPFSRSNTVHFICKLVIRFQNKYLLIICIFLIENILISWVFLRKCENDCHRPNRLACCNDSKMVPRIELDRNPFRNRRHLITSQTPTIESIRNQSFNQFQLFKNQLTLKLSDIAFVRNDENAIETNKRTD